jgi:PEGA domain
VLITAVVGALTIAGIVAYAALRPGGVLAANGPAVVPTVAPADPPASAVLVPVEKPVAIVKVRVNSDPDGATVKEDGVELCGSTPCDILYKGGDADPARDHKLLVSRQGYKAEAKTVKVGDSPIIVKLARLPDAARFAPVAPAAPQAPAPKADTPPVPTGYKTDLPY